MAPPFCLAFSLICFISLSQATLDTVFKQVIDSVNNKPAGGEEYDSHGYTPSHRDRHDCHKHDEEPAYRPSEIYKPFILDEPLVVIRSEAGVVRMLPSDRSSILMKNNVGLFFMTLEPKALLLPQYLDADCIMLVNAGITRLSFVEKNELQEVVLEVGDIYRIPGGSVFHLYNPDEGQRAQVFTIFDTSDALSTGSLQAYFVAGGESPRTLLSGFDEDVIATALKVSREKVRDLLNRQRRGPIIYSKFNSTHHEEERERHRQRESKSLWGRVLSMLGAESRKPYNILDKSPDFENENGITVSANGEDSEMLKKADLGVFAVKLKAGALLAPHWNPRASEIGFVTKGEGVIQISYPNGTNALNRRVRSGSLFFVPQYYPMCQIASRSGPFEFVGFSSSATKNKPQFLAGRTSVLRALNSSVLATAFDISLDKLKDLLESQQNAVLLPGGLK